MDFFFLRKIFADIMAVCFSLYIKKWSAYALHHFLCFAYLSRFWALDGPTPTIFTGHSHSSSSRAM